MRKILIFLPDLMTVFRIVLTALFLAMLYSRLSQGTESLPAALYAVFALICLSDFFDGAAARRLKAETVLGSVLDIAADSLFIFSSLIVFNVFRVVPVWFTAVVFADFLLFLVTSKRISRPQTDFRQKPFVFDKAGRISAVLYYLIPAAACAAYSSPGSKCLWALFHAMLYLSAFLSGISVLGRFASCCSARQSA